MLTIDEVGVHDAGCRVGEFAHVTAEEDGDLAAQHGDADGFYGGHVYVDITDTTHAVDVAESADAEEFSVAFPGVVYKTKEFVDVCSYVCLAGCLAGQLASEFEWCGMDTAELALLVVVFPSHFFVGVWRGSKHQR